MDSLLGKFVQKCPFAVMTRMLAEDFIGSQFDEVFREQREHQYERTLKFSALAMTVADITLNFCDNLNQAYKQHRERLGVSISSVYEKLRCTRPALSQAVVEHSANRARELQDAMGFQQWEVLPGYNCFDIDGNHLPKTDKRLKELRESPGAPLPGKVVARFDLQRQIFDRAYLLTDAHQQELATCDQLVADLNPRDVLIADRHYCIVGFLEKIAAASACFVIRHHGRLKPRLIGQRKRVGEIDTGTVYEQSMRLGSAADSKIVRRITVELLHPTRDGDKMIHVLTNLPSDIDGRKVAEVYRLRWEQETAFHVLQMTLTCESATLGHPHAALFVFCMAMLAYNLRQVIFAAMYAEHAEQQVNEVSHFKISVNVSRYTDGMLVVLDEEYWSKHVPKQTTRLASALCELASGINLSDYRRSIRGPKKKKPKRSNNVQSRFESTANLIRLPNPKHP